MSKPDFLYEIPLRPHGLLLLGTSLLIFGTVLGFGAYISAHFGDEEHRRWLTWGGIVGTFIFVIVCFFAIPLIRTGGTYRVLLQDGRLIVTSPGGSFLGPSFEVDLPSITRLVITVPRGDSLPKYTVHTQEGAEYKLIGYSEFPARKLFETIRSLEPSIPLEERKG